MLAVSACTSAEGGSPVPSGDAGRTGAPTTSRTTTSSSPVDSLKPCELLTSSAASTLGITGAGKAKSGSTPTCEWRVDKGSIADSYLVGIAVHDDVGLDDAVSSGAVERIEVGSRKAARFLGPSKVSCFIALELGAKSRVDVVATGGDGQKLCAPALDAAKLVEPELP
ncbi:uncharacterized protein DUF3558 [Actinokineospora cianjurensis]|uniref:Uncharacterized protein DUF3558 n=1 Tax=Actinokineospora cianjurensis TaxID=585224 RepID=A0A421B7K2_9PSEU|nr:uncharacterized protein DUF3558 [Actinokineospora cianjurensis]